MLALLASLMLSAAPTHCSPEGLYQGTVGDGPPTFFTRFSGQGRWDSYSQLDAKPYWGGPYFQDADGTLRFKLEGDGETNYPYAATFLPDCSGLVLKMTSGAMVIRFTRIPEPRSLHLSLLHQPPARGSETSRLELSPRRCPSRSLRSE